MTLRLYLLNPEVTFAARVNMPDPITYPLDELTYDTVTVGGETTVLPGQTLLLGTTAGGDDLGRQRIRRVATSTLLRVGRSSQGTRDGELNVQDNAYITILNDRRVWAKIPFIDEDGTIYKDSEVDAAGGLVEDPPPKANGGIGFAGTIDPNTEVITVEFDGSESFEFDASVSSALSGVAEYLWDVVDGTITVGTDEDAAITATFPAGFRWVRLTVTGENDRFHEHYIPVYARDPDDDDSINAFQIINRRRTAYGQEVSVRILEDIPRSTYPDGTLAMLWDDELETSDPLRVHMLFIGWHQADDAGTRHERTGTLRDTTLHLLDVAGRLKTLPGFPQVVETSADPDQWNETRYPNVFYYLWYLGYWHSTAFEVADLLLGTQILNNFDFKILSSDADNLFNQINSLANNVTPDHHFTCNRFGQLMLVVDPLIQYVGDRTATIRQSIADNEWSEIRYSYARPPRVYQLRSYAITGGTSTITPIASLAPGDAPGQGEGYIESSERIAFSQFDLNNAEGNRYARMNAPYGRFTIIMPSALLAVANDPAYMGWISLTVGSANQPQRTLPFTNQRGIVHEINIQYDYQRTGLVQTATLTWEAETSGPPAQTLELEAEEGA